jgi:hypothetical protein
MLSPTLLLLYKGASSFKVNSKKSKAKKREKKEGKV